MESAIDCEGEHPEFARVTKQLKKHKGNPVGSYNSNPILDTWTYKVDFSDGRKQAMEMIVTAYNMFSSVNKSAHSNMLLNSNIDSLASSGDSGKEDAFIQHHNVIIRRKVTTKS